MECVASIPSPPPAKEAGAQGELGVLEEQVARMDTSKELLGYLITSSLDFLYLLLCASYKEVTLSLQVLN